MKCCICGMEIDQENRSEEHIIHNAIGGILKSDSISNKNVIVNMVQIWIKHLLKFLHQSLMV